MIKESICYGPLPIIPDPRDAENARLRAIMEDMQTTKRESECSTLDDWRRKAMHYECAWRDCSSLANKRAGDARTEIESLRAQLAERDSDREYLAAAMIRCSLATADGDTLRDLVDEMEPQVVDLYAKLVESREWNQQMVEKAAQQHPTLDGYREIGAKCAALEAQLAEAQRERDSAREANKTLHRRCQDAEAALPSYRKLVALPPNGDGVLLANGNMGRVLLTALVSKQDDEIAKLREFVAAFDAWDSAAYEGLAESEFDTMLEKREAVGD